MPRLKELEDQILIVPYVELEPHLKRDAVIVVDESLALAQVALILATDDAAALRDLITKGLVAKASPLEFESWREHKQFFKLVIVQPFVLVQNFAQLSQPPSN